MSGLLLLLLYYIVIILHFRAKLELSHLSCITLDYWRR